MGYKVHKILDATLVISSAMNHAVFQHLMNTVRSSRSTIGKDFGKFGLASVDELVKGGFLQRTETEVMSTNLKSPY